FNVLSPLWLAENLTGVPPLNEERRRRETGPVLAFEGSQPPQHLRGPHSIQVPERSTAKWRESNSHHRSHVPVAGAPQHTILQTAHRFVDHSQRQPLLDLSSLQAPLLRRANERPHALVGAALLPLVVEIEAAAVLAP